MQAESNIKPPPWRIEPYGALAEIVFCENIKQEQREESIVFTYDEYRLTVPYRETLAASVGNYHTEWLQRAIANGNKKPILTVQEKLAAIQAENEDLQKQNNMLTDCLLEISEVVYD